MARRTKKQAERLLKVSGLSLKVGGSYLKQIVKEIFTDVEQILPERMETHVRNAKRIAETIGQMKGTMMKVGQMLSLNSELLPPEVTQVLSRLQKEAPPVDFDVIRAQVEGGLKGKIGKIFSAFDENPLAAASIGQVHRAQLPDGREVIVKVQYPDAHEDVDGDLQNLRLLFLSLKTIKSNFEYDHILKELRERLAEELDYQNEARNIEIFRRAFRVRGEIKIPRVIPEVSTKCILTLEYLAGTPFKDYCQREASGTKRNRVGENLVRFYLEQLFVHCLLHGDPNPGNFAVGKKGELIVYDFGCVKFFPKTFIQAYRRLLADFLGGMHENLQADFERLGFKQLEEKVYPPEFFAAYAEILMEPFLTEPYSFAAANLQEKALNLARTQIADLLNFRPPRHVVFHDRVLVGAYNNLRTLQAVGYWRTILDETVQAPVKPVKETRE